MLSLPTLAVSAPGKVLFAGGYLVLDRDYSGLVFGLNARIHVQIRPLITTSGVILEEIVVKSPQFIDATWEYGYRIIENDGGVQISPLRSVAHDSGHPNPFVETTLSYVLSYVSTLVGPIIRPSQITILADDDYYTQSNEAQKETFIGEHFKFFGVKLWEAHKTGLGSSAALVTALSGALLSHYLPKELFDLESDKGRDQLHRVAQAAHCAAQGKIGSGFDVASAVFGACVYRRFTPSVLESIGSIGSLGFSLRLKNLVLGEAPDLWDAEVSKGVKLPKGLRLAMCDVDCGSQTPGMVKKVLAWRKNEPDEANMLWTRIDQANQDLAKSLGSSNLESKIDVIRDMIRQMSRLSDVPIEPPEQTELLDVCSKLPGVIGGVVPGAGGYDAVALLIEDNDETTNKLKQCLEDWNKTGTEEFPRKASLLKVREDDQGIRLEKLSVSHAWIVSGDESVGRDTPN